MVDFRHNPNPLLNGDHERRFICKECERSELNRFFMSLRASRAAAKRKGHIPCTASACEIEKTFTGRCEICTLAEESLNRKLHLDHDHGTGEFRGWLCGNCNIGIGLLGDTREKLLRAVVYLDE